jgi:hypothetical protein
LLLAVAEAAVDLKLASRVTVTVVAEAKLEQELQVVLQVVEQVTKELEQVEQENLLEVLMHLLVAVAAVDSVAAAEVNGLVKMVFLVAAEAAALALS